MTAEFAFRKAQVLSVLKVRGEIDIMTAPLFREHLDVALAAGSGGAVVCDLTDVDRMDSIGMSVLVAAQRRAQDAGRSFAITGAWGLVLREIELAGAADFLPVQELQEGVQILPPENSTAATHVSPVAQLPKPRRP